MNDRKNAVIAALRSYRTHRRLEVMEAAMWLVALEPPADEHDMGLICYEFVSVLLTYSNCEAR